MRCYSTARHNAAQHSIAQHLQAPPYGRVQQSTPRVHHVASHKATLEHSAAKHLCTLQEVQEQMLDSKQALASKLAELRAQNDSLRQRFVTP